MLSNYRLKGPWRITFDSNPDQCNIQCIMCEEHSIYNKKKGKVNRLMDLSLIKSVVKDTIDYGLREIIPSTMGEPLIYSRFEDIIELVKKYDLKLNLTTNGTFPRLGVEKWGNLILPVASDVKISINGASKETAEKIMRGLKFEKQLENVKKFVEIRDKMRNNGVNNPTITYQVTYMESNLKELPDILKLAIELNIDRFKGHHLWIMHPELEEESLRRNEEAIKRWNKMAKKLDIIAEKNRLKNGNKIKLDNVYVLSNSKDKGIITKDPICPFLGREAWVAWDGTFNVCCAPDNLRMTFGYFGNVKEDKFIHLWNSSEYNNLVNRWGNYEVCKNCNMRKQLNEIGDC